MPDEVPSVDVDALFALAAELRALSAPPPALPAAEPPDSCGAALSEQLWRVSFLARNLPGTLASQIDVVANALNQGAVDTELADHGDLEMVDVATATTTTTTTTTPSLPPVPPDDSPGVQPSEQQPVTVTDTTTSTSVPPTTVSTQQQAGGD